MLPNNLYVLTIDGTINPIVYYKIKRSITSIKKRQGQGLILMIDTPGGLLISTRKIVQEILNSEIPVICYIAPRGAQCASAGTFIALACHIVAMAPATNIGAAHPVAIGQEMNETMQKKIVNDTISFIKSICRQTGRNEKWAEKAVRESISTPAEEAVKINVADFIANDIDDLLNKIDKKEVKLASGKKVILQTKSMRPEVIKEGFGEKILNTIGDPTVAYLLMTIGIIGIIIEFSHPGFAVPGVIGTICLILSLFAFQTFTQSIAGVLLILTGIILLLAEIFAPGFGIFAIGGFIAMGLGTWLFFRSAQNEHKPAAGVFIMLYALLIILITGLLLFIRNTRRRKITTGKEGIIGEFGKTITDLSPDGTVYVHGEYWKATSAGEKIPANTKVKVKKIEGMVLVVEEEKNNEK
ncbi:MAG: nodulation protein NfeD [Candidatus Omnitrophica bacterium]|nr:nodulation protein NfeD [Candidatus Omnitrophota bacterium]